MMADGKIVFLLLLQERYVLLIIVAVLISSALTLEPTVVQANKLISEHPPPFLGGGIQDCLDHSRVQVRKNIF
jgi:hypothetical protein